MEHSEEYGDQIIICIMNSVNYIFSAIYKQELSYGTLCGDGF